MLKYIDTHCHLDMSSYTDDLSDVLMRSEQHNISHIISIGIDLETSQEAIKLSKKHKMISATIGIHPHDIESVNDATYQELESLIENNKTEIVGYGEIGLDYFKDYSDHSIQRTHFRKQLELAKEKQLPVIIHDRDAHDDVLQIITETGPFPNGGVMHCFSGDYELAKKVIDLGFYVSIPGIVTFKNAKDLHEVAFKIPLSRMLLETDGPFLAPQPHRGKRNEPSYIPIIAQRIAELRNCDIEEIALSTTQNACTLFNLKQSK